MQRKYGLISAVFLTALVFAGCASKEVIPFKERYKVAILPVRSGLQGDEKIKRESLVADTFTTELLENQRVRLIERSQIVRLLKEQELVQQGIVDEKSAAKIGKMVGADAVLVSDLTIDIDESKMQAVMVKHNKVKYIVRVSAKIIDVETGEILAAARDSDKKEEDFGVTITSHSEGGETVANIQQSREKEIIASLIVSTADDVADDLSDMMPARK